MLVLGSPQSSVQRSQDSADASAIGVRISYGRTSPELITTMISEQSLSALTNKPSQHSERPRRINRQSEGDRLV